MRMISNEFAITTSVSSAQSEMPRIGWPLFIAMAPVLIVYWIVLATVLVISVAAKRAFRSVFAR